MKTFNIDQTKRDIEWLLLIKTHMYEKSMTIEYSPGKSPYNVRFGVNNQHYYLLLNHDTKEDVMRALEHKKTVVARVSRVLV